MDLEMAIEQMLEEGEKFKWLIYRKAQLEHQIRIGMEAAEELEEIMVEYENQKCKMLGFLCIR